MYDQVRPYQDEHQDQQTDLINKMTQIFNEDVKSLMTFNTPATPHKGIVHNK